MTKFTKDTIICHTNYCFKYIVYTGFYGVILPVFIYCLIKYIILGESLKFKKGNIRSNCSDKEIFGVDRYSKFSQTSENLSTSSQNVVSGAALANIGTIKSHACPIDTIKQVKLNKISKSKLKIKL